MICIHNILKVRKLSFYENFQNEIEFDFNIVLKEDACFCDE